jgi:hypothetical protein
MTVGYSAFSANDPLPSAAPDGGNYTLERALRILREGVRPEDCLPVTDEVRRVMAVEEAYFTERLGGTPPAANYMHGLQVNYTLAAHLPGCHVAYLDDPHGVAVLAVGLDAISPLIRSAPPALGPVFAVTYIDPADAPYLGLG